MLDFGLHMDSLLHTYVAVHVYTQFRRALDPPGHNYCENTGVSRVLNEKMVVSDELEVASAIGASYLMTRCASSSKVNPFLFLKLLFKKNIFYAYKISYVFLFHDVTARATSLAKLHDHTHIQYSR